MYVCHGTASPVAVLCLVPDVDDLLDVLLGDRDEAENAAVEGLLELR